MPLMSGGMDFGEALQALREGQSVARNGWAHPNARITLSPACGNTNGVELAAMLLFYPAPGDPAAAWCPSQTDVLADDWGVWSG